MVLARLRRAIETVHKVVLALVVFAVLIVVPAVIMLAVIPPPDGPTTSPGESAPGAVGPTTPAAWQTPFPQATPRSPIPTRTVDGTQGAANPWNKTQVVVAVHNRAYSDRPFVQTVRSAIAYWEANLELADYPVDFVLRPNASAPDVLVQYRTTIDCQTHANVDGCAPVLDAHTPAAVPVTVRVLAQPDANFRADRNTVIHELGHVLGRQHCEQPAWVMASGCSATESRPNVSETEYAWRTTTLRMYVDYSDVEAGEVAETKQQVRLAFGFYADGGNGTVPQSLAFRQVSHPWLADIRVHVNESSPGGRPGCTRLIGGDSDGDEAMEYYTTATICLNSPTLSHRGWHLGLTLGAVLTPDGIPASFEGSVSSDPWRG